MLRSFVLLAALTAPVVALAAVHTTPAPAQRTVAQAPAFALSSDPFLWLEQKDSPRALAWVRAQNAKTEVALERSRFYAPMYRDALAVEQSKDRIPEPMLLHGEIYNFWQDEHHVRGIWRKTSLTSYQTANPQWQTVLDLDALARTEKANWVWEGVTCREPDETRCMIALSDGGEDAQTLREFDLQTAAFVPDGFVLPRAKQSADWLDAQTLIVSRPWEAGQVTTSGYAYVVKTLRRGLPLAQATEVFRGAPTDVSAQATSLVDGDGHHVMVIQRATTFFTVEHYVITSTGTQRLNMPLKVDVNGLVGGRLIVSLNEPWNASNGHFEPGSVVQFSLDDALSRPNDLRPTLVYSPGPRESIGQVAIAKHELIVASYENVRGRATLYAPNADGSWATHRLPLPDMSSVDVVATSPQDDRAFIEVRSFLQPSTLYLANAQTSDLSRVKALPAQFDASHDVVEQHEATSRDGTRVPYFVVRPTNLRFNGHNPTVINAYGGFQISSTPEYSATIGRLWLSRGGVYVLANIRGGGEFGPAWHEAGLKTNRQRIYDDFSAVGRDLVARKITEPRHLGIYGGSNGGLLMGVEFTQHPETWNSVEIGVPLLDMLRYEQIQAGASWVAEYGSVSIPAERAFLASISPYNNVRAGVAYPMPFIWTTTKDDRVGPQHARKFAAKLAAMHVPYYFYEVIEGGHGAGANLAEAAKTTALRFTYHASRLMR